MPQHTSLAVADLSTFHKNPRRGVIAEIVKSLTRHGQYRTIVVNSGSLTGRVNEVLAGNHTFMAARELGWESIDCTVIDVDDESAKAICAGDNHLADLGGYDDHALYELLSSLEDLSGTGYGESDVARLERDLFPPEPHTDPDDAPDVPPEPISQVGEVWQLGPHRLLVGSSTDLDSVRRLCGDVRPDCVWTDPPYGVEYVGKTKAALTIQNDGAAGLPDLLAAAFANLVVVCRAGAPVYVAHADTERVTFETAMRGAGLLVRQNLVWVKNTMVLGRSDYHYQHEPILYAEVDDGSEKLKEHEPILYGFTPGAAGRLGRGGERWHGDNRQTTVFEIAKPPRNAQHPTMKPVALIQAMLRNSLRPGGVVYEPFAGSGSTLIAAHGLGGRAFCVELDPRYADVILRRFEAHTGVVPTIDGVPVSFAGVGTS